MPDLTDSWPSATNNHRFSSFYMYGKFCPRRNLQASKVHKYFLTNGLKAASDPNQADLIIIFTCGIYKHFEEFSIATIESAIKNRKAKTIITGCLPKIAPHRLSPFSEDATIMLPENLDLLDGLIGAETAYKDITNFATTGGYHELVHGNIFHRLKKANLESIVSMVKNWYVNRKFSSKLKSPTTGFDIFSAPTTYRLEIGKGCLNACSFCAIKIAMEKFRSFPQDKILAELKYGLSNGYSDFVLISADIGCYGLDRKTNLSALLKALFAHEGEFKILLWDLNARWFVKFYEEFRDVLKLNHEKVSGMVVPIQSGSNRILRLMNRGYKIEDVKECLLDLQKNIPEIPIATHMIVGFPGETDEDFQKSVELVKSIDFSEVCVFKYHERPNTRAAEFPDKVPAKVINERARVLAESTRGVILS